MPVSNNVEKMNESRNTMRFTIKIHNSNRFRIINYLAFGLMLFGIIMISQFIYNSLDKSVDLTIQILFTVFGILGLIGIFRLVREIILPHIGIEKLTITSKEILYKGNVGLITKSLKIKLSDIKNVELRTFDQDQLTRSLSMFYAINYGIIIIQYSGLKTLSFGHSLSKEKIIDLKEQIEKCRF